MGMNFTNQTNKKIDRLRLRKVRLAKAIKRNRPVPMWKRNLKNGSQTFNRFQRSWRRTRLNIR